MVYKGWTTGVRFPVGAGKEPHPDRLWGPLASISVGIGDLSPVVKQAGREADHSRLSSAEVNECLHGLVLR